MRALIERIRRWVADRAEQRRRQEALARWRGDAEQHVSDNILVVAWIAVALVAGAAANGAGALHALNGPTYSDWPIRGAQR